MKTIATWIRECDAAPFERTFAPYPGVLLENARTGPVSLDGASGLLLTGGSDISEKFLHQPVPDLRLIEDADPARDVWEFDALKNALARKLPLLAICRGLQVLNVALGGTLHLDIPHHDSAKYENVQALRYADGVAIRFPRVNSSHHQALDKLGAGLVAEAWCADDDVIEGARLDRYPFGLAVQFHPERDSIYKPLFDAFVKRVQQQ